MHSAAEELSTGPRLTTVMKPIPVSGGGERVRERKWDRGTESVTCRNDKIITLEKVNINCKCM